MAAALLGAALVAGGASAARAQSVLFIGNSFTFADYGRLAKPAGGVPELFRRIAGQGGHDPSVMMVATPGETLRGHAEDEHGEIEAIRSRQWDYVVLQGYSSEATHAAPRPGDFTRYGRQLAADIRRNDPATKIVLYQTWAYPPGSPVYGGGRFASPAAMFSEIAAGYRALATAIGARVAPVGAAFALAQLPPSSYELYAHDPADPHNYHANDAGYTLSALVMARTIYGPLPRALTPPLPDIEPGEMARLAGAADAAVSALGTGAAAADR